MRTLNLKGTLIILIIASILLSACGVRGIADSDIDWAILIVVSYNDCFTILQRFALCEEYVPSIRLDYFINQDITDVLSGNTDEEIDSRELFRYHLIAIDGWSPRRRDMPDLYWHEFKTGFFNREEGFRAVFPEFEVQTYNVRNLQKIELVRIVE